jgi:hypothetical protein
MGFNFRYPRNGGGGGVSNKLDEGRTGLQKTFDGTEQQEAVQRSNYDGGELNKANSEYANLLLPNQSPTINISIQETPQEEIKPIYLFQNRGINYRNSRSSGGRFFSERVDEGRSNLTQDLGELYVAPVIPEVQATALWEWDWNSNLSSSLDGPYYIGSNGTVSASLVSTVTQGTQLRRIPRIEIGYSSDFGSHLSGVAIYRLKTPALPKRFKLQLKYQMVDGTAGVRTPSFGLLFNATKIDSQAELANLYGSMLWFHNAGIKVYNVQSGSMGPGSVYGGTSFGYSSEEEHLMRMSIEMRDVVGDAKSGSVWRALFWRYDDSTSYNADNTFNWASASYAPWTNDGTVNGTPISGCNNVYLVLGAITGGAGSSNRKMNFQDLAIMRHEMDIE